MLFPSLIREVSEIIMGSRLIIKSSFLPPEIKMFNISST